MKKRWITLFVLLPILLCSCGQTPSVSRDGSTDTAAASGEQKTSAEALLTESAEKGPVESFSEEDLIFEYEGEAYPLNSDAAPLLLAFGSEYKVTKAPSCAYIGEDKVFEYDFAAIYTYPLEGKDMIDEIDFFGREYYTNRGVGMGSTLDEIKEAYGSNGFDMDGMYVYVLSGNPEDLKSPKLYFQLSDGAVTGISYYAASNLQQ